VNKDDYDGVIRSRLDTTIGSAGYVVEADLDRDGKVAQSDYDIAVADDGKSSSGGVGEAGLFSRGVRNGVGYCGYIFNDESGLYTVRFRSYSPTLGRWLERDPAGYVDGLSLYEYVRGGPIAAVDPSGLSTATGDRWWEPRPGAVRCRCVTQPLSRDLVFDFVGDPDHPSPAGTIEIDTWAELVEELERRIAEGTAGKCWTIAGHGKPGRFIPYGAVGDGVTDVEINSVTIQNERVLHGNQEYCARQRASPHSKVRDNFSETQALLRFIELARRHLSSGGTLEFGSCESGQGQLGERLGESLARELLGVRVLLYDKKISWHDVGWAAFPFGSSYWTDGIIFRGRATPREYLCEPECNDDLDRPR
jgi:RHS repeat-associated protein